jgi:rfaE bifunctional protein nucleotidyltransferase chain/domain
MRSLVIIGDVMLAVDVSTDARRLSPDGAAPVLEQRSRQERAGGAALAAACAAAEYPGPVVLVAPMSDDAPASAIATQLHPRVELVRIPATGHTPVKTRLRCGTSTVARLDEGDATLSVQASERVVDALASGLSAAGAILVSDYGGGLTRCGTIRRLLADAASHGPVLWDPHPRGADPVPGAALVTPNAAEAARIAGEDVPPSTRVQAQHLLHRWRAHAVAVTLGRQGALLVDGSGRCTAYPTPTDVDGDACGAGDYFAATAAAALLTGELPSDAVRRAVHAASGFIASGGVGGKRTAEPDATADLDRFLASHRARGATVVATGGCFDLLHAGHIATLEAARRLGDCLIVCINSDESVRRAKGPGRPLQSAADRARVLSALRMVDRVVVFDEDTPHRVLRRVRPDVWVKGDDYTAAELPETALVRGWGGEVLTVPYLSGRSTTRLVEGGRQTA